MKILLVFIDGFGIGCKDPDRNPFHVANLSNITAICEKWPVFPTDAALGVSGLPQSATGQTSIFTGINAQGVLGRHLNGQPTETLKRIIWKNGLFKRLQADGQTVTNANVYRDEYLTKMLDSKDRRNRPSVTSVMTMAAGLSFRTVRDYLEGQGVYHDITGKILVEGGHVPAEITPAEAAVRLHSISRGYDFTLYEHFMTDIVGHKGEMHEAVTLLERIDLFLGALIDLCDLKKETIILVSDHGNIEDISVKTHTLNPVPTIIIGKGAGLPGLKIESLLDILPLVVKLAGFV